MTVDRSVCVIPFLRCRGARNRVKKVVLVPEPRHAPARLLDRAELAHDSNLEARLLEQLTHGRAFDRLARLEAAAGYDARKLRFIAKVEDEQLVGARVGLLASDVDDDSRPSVQRAASLCALVSAFVDSAVVVSVPHRVKAPFARHALELLFAAVAEADA